ncbi:hypothetical protein FKM82_005587 [Ascaphus truei]
MLTMLSEDGLRPLYNPAPHLTMITPVFQQSDHEGVKMPPLDENRVRITLIAAFLLKRPKCTSALQRNAFLPPLAARVNVFSGFNQC